MGFSLPQLSSCCCGCTLRTGTLIILWLYLVFSILSIVLPILVLVMKMQPESTKVDSDSVDTSQPWSKPQPPDLSKMPTLGIWDIMAVISIFVSCIGLYGTYKELHLYLTPFLAWEMVYLIIQAILELFLKFSVSEIMGDIIGFSIAFYLWLVVFSHYRVMKGSVRPVQV